MAHRSCRGLTLALFQALILFVLISFPVYAGEVLVQEITIDGNKYVSAETILGLITHTQVGAPLSEPAIDADREAIFESGYFWTVKPARISEVGGGVKVIFQVVENPIVSGVMIKTESLPADELAAYMSTQPGQILNVRDLRKDLNEVLPEKAIKEFGTPIRVTDADISPDTGQVKITLKEKRLAELRVAGNTKTKDYVILREIRMEPGDVVNLKELDKGLRRVLMLGIFDEVGREIEAADDIDQLVVTVKVKERKTNVATGGVGYSSTDGWLGYLEIASENFLGKGQKLNARTEFGSKRKTYSVGFQEPYLDSKGTSLGFNIYNTTRTLTDTQTKEEYEQSRVGGDVTIGKPLTEFTRGYVTAKVERSEIDHEPFTTRSVRVTTVTNTSDHPFFPSDGFKLRLSTEAAGHLLGGDNEFIRYEADYSKYLKAGSGRRALAFRLSTGLVVGDDVYDPEKFRVGGSESIRGYAYGDFVGTRKLVLNSEYRFQIKDAFHAVVFTDAGNAWDEDESLDLSDLYVGYGAGLRIDTPLGVLRFDYGIGDGDGNFYFSIGQMF